MALVSYAILNDIHFPFQSPDYPLALKVLQDIPNLSGIYLNGDIGEFQTISSHLKTPGGFSLLKDEAKYVNRKLDELEDMFFGIPITFIEGNHCYRLWRYLMNNCPALFGIEKLSIPALLNLHERGIDHVAYGPTQLHRCGQSNLYLRHEPVSGGANHARATAVEYSVDIAYGHTHVYQQHSLKKKGPTPYTVTATSLGFLGNIENEIFNYRGSKDQWVNGFGVVQCDTETGKYRLDFVRLDDGLAIYGGKAYRRDK